jgi:hypothetical protein
MTAAADLTTPIGLIWARVRQALHGSQVLRVVAAFVRIRQNLLLNKHIKVFQVHIARNIMHIENESIAFVWCTVFTPTATEFFVSLCAGIIACITHW